MLIFLLYFGSGYPKGLLNQNPSLMDQQLKLTLLMSQIETETDVLLIQALADELLKR